MRTFKGIVNKKGPMYKVGYKRANRKKLTNSSLLTIRREIQKELFYCALAEFDGKKRSTSALERYVGLADGYGLSARDVLFLVKMK